MPATLSNGTDGRVITVECGVGSTGLSPWRTTGTHTRWRNRSITHLFQSELLDLVIVASECVRAWDGFLRENGLDPSSLSASAQALVGVVVPGLPAGGDGDDILIARHAPTTGTAATRAGRHHRG